MDPSIKGETLAPPSELPINQGLEICLSTWTEPCPNVWPFDRQLGMRSCWRQHPMTKGASPCEIPMRGELWAPLSDAPHQPGIADLFLHLDQPTSTYL